MSIALTCLVIASCDFFSTGNPESPNPGTDAIKYATSPEDLIGNFKNSFETGSLELYTSCFGNDNISNSYTYYPANESTSIYPSLSNWNAEKEIKYFKNIYISTTKDTKNKVILGLNYKFSNRTTDSVTCNADYSIIYLKASADSEFYSGKLEMQLKKSSQDFWIIRSWKELQKIGKYCWSDFKGKYSY